MKRITLSKSILQWLASLVLLAGTSQFTAAQTPATALDFDGTDDYINCGANPKLNLTSSISVEAWINRSAPGTDDCIIGKDNYAASTGYGFWVYQTNKLIFRFGNRECASIASIPSATWTHVAATYDAVTSTVKLYINGVLDNTITAFAPPVSNTGGLFIGTPQDAVANPSFAFSGSIDEVRIWNRSLCQGEIQNNRNCLLSPSGQTGLLALYHFNQGFVGANNSTVTTATDAGADGNNGTLLNFALTGTTSNWIAGIATTACTAYAPAGLGATTGGAQVCQSAMVQSPGTNYLDENCNLLARVNPSGASPVSGSVSSCVKIDATVQNYGNQPYVQRHYDITPATNAATATATVTLYFTQADFDNYNAVRGSNPPLPASSVDVAGVAELVITQYHGTGTAPGNYTGSSILINPNDGNIVWNSVQGRWEVTFDVNGFSGFFVHTTVSNTTLPLKLVAFTANRNGTNNHLQWATTGELNTKDFVLQRSTTGQNFTDVAMVPSKGAGNNQYSYEDAFRFDGAVYYQVKITDNNGRYTFSAVAKLFGYPTTGVSVYPNPVKGKTTVLVNDRTLIGEVAKIIDAGGRMVHQFTIKNSVQNLDLQYLLPGIYLLNINGRTQKLVVE
ncbi:MAG: hypothetical protein JWR72_3020 [Flavisolibacter sp.]|nr:hypothetical protein [Flavisolibacter sp.]